VIGWLVGWLVGWLSCCAALVNLGDRVQVRRQAPHPTPHLINPTHPTPPHPTQPHSTPPPKTKRKRTLRSIHKAPQHQIHRLNQRLQHPIIRWPSLPLLCRRRRHRRRTAPALRARCRCGAAACGAAGGESLQECRQVLVIQSERLDGVECRDRAAAAAAAAGLRSLGGAQLARGRLWASENGGGVECRLSAQLLFQKPSSALLINSANTHPNPTLRPQDTPPHASNPLSSPSHPAWSPALSTPPPPPSAARTRAPPPASPPARTARPARRGARGRSDD